MNIPLHINRKRVNCLKKAEIGTGPVVYWMERDQRATHNWALLEAARLALELNRVLIVLFTLTDNLLEIKTKYDLFRIKGLKETEEMLNAHNIPLNILIGNPVETVSQFIIKNKAATLICDFNPLRIQRQWKTSVVSLVNTPVYEVDAHNIVPCQLVSTKQEYGAYTLRPKIMKLLPDFLDQFPDLPKFEYKSDNHIPHHLESLFQTTKTDKTASESTRYTPGYTIACEKLETFLNQTINKYDKDRNDPNQVAGSNLSPYLNFGQISAQYIALQTIVHTEPSANRDAFLEQLIVRRELSDNYCWYNMHYDSYDGFPNWAKSSHEKHERDEREYVYQLEAFENAITHDLLWNAAQREMVNTGKMHAYLRMYWAKKILEWTQNANEAMAIAIYLNDKYQLDGRDPNGYAGIAWSIGGVHDRAWFERPVFGLIRYMNYNGCKSKFDVKKYITLNS